MKKQDAVMSCRPVLTGDCDHLNREESCLT